MARRRALPELGRALLALADDLEAALTPADTAAGRPVRAVHVRAAQQVLDAFAEYDQAAAAKGGDDEEEADERDVRALLAAFEQITGRGTRAYARFSPGQDRWPKGHPLGGQWRPDIAGIVDRLGSHLKAPVGSRVADPFDATTEGGKRYSDATLRKVARGRGIEIPRGAERDVVVKALVDDLEGKELRSRNDEGGAIDVDHESRRTLAILAGGKKTTIRPDRMDSLMHAIREIKPGTFNFSRLQVAGKANEKMFRAVVAGQNRPRDTMPQLPTGHGEENKTSDGRLMDDFERFLGDRGVDFSYGRMDPRELVASQSELNGVKVAKIWGFMEKGWKPGGVMIVARHGDGWAVVDGHHRWAGAAARSISEPMLVDAMFVDADINDVIGTEADPKGIVMDFASFESLTEDREANVDKATDLLQGP